uniref:Phosphoribosyltransferase domain-containing protein n=1 Tax=Mucochytrium quahogii TaxID=96639 RepID=A0A7S2WJP2_9STRA|mmetsp:Transcript_7699/g.12463  ORF Transcript_7699/g.12463 Transcript_7699/m.12463 type:complete len:206 (+) Transcript_7699:90-707(+)
MQVDEKTFFSYVDIHDAVDNVVDKLNAAQFKVDYIIAIGGGGLIPARIIRTVLRKPILCVTFEHYQEETNKRNEQIRTVQWLDRPELIKGKNVILVDDCDETRKTLEICVDKLKALSPARIAVCVLHNKSGEKVGKLPADVLYCFGEVVPPRWNAYPWDALKYGNSIQAHEALCKKDRIELRLHVGSFIFGMAVMAILSMNFAKH